LISALHSDAKRIAYGKGIDIDKEDGKLWRKILHEPTIDLRRGISIDVEAILHRIDDQSSKIAT
jgi:hypothetical protein